MRVVRAIGALGALAVLLVGVPWALARFGNVPELLTLDWASALGGVQGGRLMLGLLSAAGWVAWLVLAATTVLEAVAVASRYRVSVTLPGTGWLRPVVSTLLLAAVGAPGAVLAHAAQLADAGAVPAPQGPVGVAAVAPATATPATPAMEVADAPVAAMTRSAPGTATRAYVVQAGDELWALAERELGSGDRWRRIVALNPELGDSGKLTPGAVVQLPATKGAPAAPSPSGEAEVRVIVGDGESLWLIAERELGDAERWPEIFALNRDQIADPDQIDIGWVLRLPGPQAVDTREKPPAERAVDRPAERAPAETDEAPPAAHEADMPPASTSPEPAPSAMVPIAVPEQPTRSPASPATEATALPVASVGAEADPMVLAAPLGAALAGAILLSVSTRRRAQLLGRAIGRRLIPASPQVTRFWTALARYAEEPEHANGRDDVGPTALVLGWRGDEPVTVDLEAARATLLSGSRAEEAVAAALTSLACAPWSADVGVIVVGAPEWVDALDDPRFDSEPDVASGLVRLSRFAAERRLALRDRDLVSARADVETAEAWRPTVFVFAQTLSPSQLDALADALAMGETGVSVLTLAGAEAHIDARRARIEDETAYLDDTQFAPQLLSSPAKHALLALFATTGRTETERAPWWRHDENLPPNIHHLPPADARHGEEPATAAARLSTPEHPTLLLLGPVGLSGTSGRPPSRAVGQCVEYCAWLLANPGATSTTMLRDLIVAEGTRRSNMSRLRGWLGSDEAGQPYLPDAYTGRITLDSRVTSDWEQLQLLLSGGVNLAPDASLRRALALVRGEPLGDVAFQWHWAEQLRADMVSTIVDAVCVLADRAIARSDHVVALWSIGRGLVAAPGDDQLLVRRIDALMVAGRTDEAHQLVVSLNRGLRDAGRDLAPELARRLHLALGAMNAGGGLAEPTQNLG